MIAVSPETAKEALAAWDRNEPVITLSFRGQSPTYEQTMHVAVFGTVRAILAAGGPPEDAPGRVFKLIVRDRLREMALRRKWQLSPDQEDRAAELTWRYLQNGWMKTLESFPVTHQIEVLRRWPQE